MSGPSPPTMLCPPPGGRPELEGAPATVLVGELARLESPARRDTEHLGVELTPRRPGILVPLYDDHEHALVVLRSSLEQIEVGRPPGNERRPVRYQSPQPGGLTEPVTVRGSTGDPS